MMPPEHRRLQSKAGYIDARPHIRHIGKILLQRTAGPYNRVRLDNVCSMSDLPPKRLSQRIRQLPDRGTAPSFNHLVGEGFFNLPLALTRSVVSKPSLKDS